MSWLDTHPQAKRRFSLGGGVSGPSAASVEPEINLIPFIDVLLVVLIFLMISTTFTRYQELAITLPTANGSESQAEVKQIHIAVSRDGRFAINGKVTDRSQLSNTLTQLNGQSAQKDGASSLQVNIDADARAPHQAVMSALEAARDANLSNIVFSSQINNQAKK
ncbi:biopolymer transporter ExbD [Polynucleobacter sp. JS-Polo-80-F4]|uniref:ExbD/TolR family protein n=1 Tax=Polynucleobacter sp. JS-Polo-80-F4 TaxID=2576918 RepID=UPI001C0B9CA6|nr:biopolymer transporter ExbD [Polynucleobacter sp. JS-Polo-80-F4]MBU3616705.1 biopolymer transporter ExbD [Polynucleobacter sp. JS-Polo-80-F4]